MKLETISKLQIWPCEKLMKLNKNNIIGHE